MSTLRGLQLCGTSAALVVAGLVGSVDVGGQTPAAPKVPLLVGLTIVTALNQPDQGDYESIKTFIKVNDKTTVDFVDEKNTYTKGHLALQQHAAFGDNPQTVLQVRKIEVKELTPAKNN